MAYSILFAFSVFWAFINLYRILPLNISSMLWHIITYMPLFCCILYNHSTYLLFRQKGLIITAIISILFHYFLGRNYAWDLFELMVIPALLINSRISFYRLYNREILSYGILCVLLFNCIITFYEYKYQVNLFYEDLSYFTRFRSSGIWGHPLYSALITGCGMLFILLSNFNVKIKVITYFLCLFAIFCYDARTATFLSIAASIAILFVKKAISKKNLIYICIVLIAGYFSYEFLSNSDLGGKVFDPTKNKFSDVDARLVPFKIFSDIPWTDLITGINTKFLLLKKYDVIAIENSFIALSLKYGFIFTSFMFYFAINMIWQMMKGLNFKIRCICLSYFIIVGLTSEALVSPYVWGAYILMYLSLVPPNYIKKQSSYA